MKKMAVFIFVGILAFLGAIFPKNDLFEMEGALNYCMVLSAQDAQKEGLEFTESGTDAIVNFSDKEKAKQIYNKTAPKCLIITFDKERFDQVQEFLNISQSFTQNLHDLQILYGYTSLYPESKFVDGKKVNVQMVLKENELIVGFPMIMTGY